MKRPFFAILGLIAFTLFPPFCQGAPYSIAARTMNLNGYNLYCDSFNSSDPNLSTGGLYDPLKVSDGAGVASENGIFNANNVGNVEIWGRLSTESPFTLAIGPLSSIGSIAWHQAGQLGIEPGFHDTNLDWMFPDAAVPFFAGFFPTSGTVNGVFYNYIFEGPGDYVMPALTLSGNQKALVRGYYVRLHVTGNVSLSGNAYIRILPTARLDLYVGGATANLRGSGVINEGFARNFNCISVAGNTAVNIRMPTPFVGNVYAPTADLTVSAAGSGSAEIVGTIVCRTLDLAAPLRLHLDEAPGQP